MLVCFISPIFWLQAILKKKNVKRLASRSHTQPGKVLEGNSLVDDDDVTYCGYCWRSLT